MAMNPRQSPASSVPSAKRKKQDVYKLNATLFRTVERSFQDASPANLEKFKSDTHKLARYLSDSRGYYDSARPEIIKLVATVQRSLQKELGVDSPQSIPSEAFQTHPIGKCFLDLMLVIRPHVHLFVERDLKDISIRSLRLVGLEPPPTPPTPSAASIADSSRVKALSSTPTPAPASAKLSAVQQLSNTRPLTPGSISVPLPIANQMSTRCSPHSSLATDPATRRPQLPVNITGSIHPQEQPPRSRTGGDATPTASSRTLGASPIIPTTESTMQNPGPSRSATQNVISGNAPSASPSVGSQPLPPPHSAKSVYSTISMSITSGLRPKKKRKMVDLASLQQRDIASFRQRTGIVPTPPNSATPIVVKTEDEDALPAFPEAQTIQNSGSIRSASPVATQEHALNSGIPAPIVVPARQSAPREPSLTAGTASSQVRAPSVAHPAPAQDVIDVDSYVAPVPVVRPLDRAVVKVEEPEETQTPSLRPLSSPLGRFTNAGSTESVEIPLIAHPQAVLPAIPPIEERTPSFRPPAGSTPSVKQLLDIPAAAEESMASRVRSTEVTMEMEVDHRSTSKRQPPPLQASQPAHTVVQTPEMTRTVSASSTVSMSISATSARPASLLGSFAQTVNEPEQQVPEPRTTAAPVEPLQQPAQDEDTAPPAKRDTTSNPEHAMQMEGPLAPQVQQPSPSPSPAPPGTIFGNDIKVILFKQGTVDCDVLHCDFELSSEQASLVQRWWAQSGTPSEMRESLCLSLGCYSENQLDFKQRFLPQLQSMKPQWPDDGGLSIKFETLERMTMTLPLAPPFSVTPDSTFDMSFFIKAGHNTFQIIQKKDWSKHCFALFLHRPTQAQVDKVKQKRRNDEDWENWKVAMAQPLPLNLPIARRRRAMCQ